MAERLKELVIAGGALMGIGAASFFGGIKVEDAHLPVTDGYEPLLQSRKQIDGPVPVGSNNQDKLSFALEIAGAVSATVGMLAVIGATVAGYKSENKEEHALR